MRKEKTLLAIKAVYGKRTVVSEGSFRERMRERRKFQLTEPWGTEPRSSGPAAHLLC